MQDHYETLQVHPKADAETIRAAYGLLAERYAAERLEGVAEELQHLASQRREALERAFRVLSDPQQRAEYDAALANVAPAPEAAADEELDYRPLPPANRQERPADFNAQPTRRATRQQRGRTSAQARQPEWLAPALIVGVCTFVIVLATLLSTVLGAPPPAAPAATVPPNNPAPAATQPDLEGILNQFETQILSARQVVNTVPDHPNAWLQLGHALYDSVMVVRERLDQGDLTVQSLYVERLPRWLEAADAYRRASELDPSSALAHADLAASLCYYGQSINDQNYIREGLTEAERALALDANEGRALLGAGICYAFADPPQLSAALEQWQRLVLLPEVEPGLIFQARQLIQEYSQ
ncbi:MAG: J domain-containing protein [Candidatus Viridilinea halotolerans]|uniref:J domain-containing protein n=1 Tax=Candidatus Viridilinea halotolerans TaxID=2491704 RepID=A0A426U3D5_9CHLR|nr:MAG: J domain-containing protein [Candidatus Viridilinea halotolerans]